MTRINPILILWWHWLPLTPQVVYLSHMHTHVHTHTFPLCGIEPVFTATPSILPWLLCTSWKPHGARWLVHWGEIVHRDGRSLKGLIFVSTIHLCWGLSGQDAELLTSALRMSACWPSCQRKHMVTSKENKRSTCCRIMKGKINLLNSH